jgi:hypothetical protein
MIANQRRCLSPFIALWLVTLASVLWAGPIRAADLTLDVRLIWGSNDKTSPDPTHKPIDTPLTRKLGKLLTWKHYFEVNRKEIAIPLNAAKTIELSGECAIEVKNLGESRVEVKLFRAGKFVSKTVEAVPKGDWLLLGGDSANKTAWFVVLKTAEPKG